MESELTKELKAVGGVTTIAIPFIFFFIVLKFSAIIPDSLVIILLIIGCTAGYFIGLIFRSTAAHLEIQEEQRECFEHISEQLEILNGKHIKEENRQVTD